MLYKGPLYAKVAGKYVPVEHDAQYYDRLEAENARLRKILQTTVVVMNPVTAFHRHHNQIPRERLDKLSNWQIEIEKVLNQEEPIK